MAQVTIMGMFDRPDRPKAVVKTTPWEMAVEVVALAALLLNIAIMAYFWSQLPYFIPMQASQGGLAVTGWSRTTALGVVTLLPLVIYAGTTLMGRFARWFSYPVPITAENAAREYRLAANLLRYIKAEVMVSMLYVEWVYIQIGLGNVASLHVLFLPALMAVLAITFAYFFFEMFRQK